MLNQTVDLRKLNVLSRNERIIYLTANLVLITIGIVLNLMVVLFYIMNKIRPTNFNYCLTHLSVANIVQYIGFIPYVAFDVRQFPNYHGNVIQVHVLCALKDGVALFFLGTNTSAYILLWMAIVRYKVIKNPFFTYKYTKTKSRYYIILFWFISFLLVLPNFLTLKTEGELPVCIRVFTFFGKTQFQIFGFSTMFFGFISPVVAFIVLYVLTVIELYRSTKLTSHNRSNNRNSVLRVLGVIIFSFVVCWIPFATVWCLSASREFFDKSLAGEIHKARIYRFTFLPCLLTGISNVLCNAMCFINIRKALESQRGKNSTLRMEVLSSIKAK